MRNRRQRFRPDCDRLEVRSLLSGYSPASQNGFTPSQIASAYGLNAISFTSANGSSVKGDGTGETIALIEINSDPNLQSDLQTFDARYGLPDPALTVVNLAGSQPTQVGVWSNRWTSSGHTPLRLAPVSWWWRPHRPVRKRRNCKIS